MFGSLSKLWGKDPKSQKSGKAKPSPEDRKLVKLERREQLYAVIREGMTHSGLVSTGYKFKVLSVDGGGLQYMVMMDVKNSPSFDSTRQTGLETWMTKNARERFGIKITAVYWRTGPAEVATPRVLATPPRSSRSNPDARFEPISTSEVEEFKRAMEKGVSHNFNQESLRSQGGVDIDIGLSGTQYGDLS